MPTFEDIREAVLQLSKADQMRLLALVALKVVDAHPGIDFKQGVCGGSARIVRSRIPVWTLEEARRQGMTDGEILRAYPSLTAEDLANAWNYARTHYEEMDREITENNDHS
jgi:uncharacterized protein (DUF433 family)